MQGRKVGLWSDDKIGAYHSNPLSLSRARSVVNVDASGCAALCTMTFTSMIHGPTARTHTHTPPEVYIYIIHIHTYAYALWTILLLAIIEDFDAW